MNLVWKGINKSNDQLPVGRLPENAVKFKEPNSMAMLNVVASLFVIPIFIFVGATMFLKYLISGDPEVFSTVTFNFLGITLAFIAVLPHELLHAKAFPKQAEVELWVKPKALIAFVVSTYPVTKNRFIFISLLPNLIFGFIPLMIWVFVPGNSMFNEVLFSFATFSLLLGVGDYLNVFNTITQMPKGSMTQLSGMNSYWYMPDENEKSNHVR